MTIGGHGCHHTLLSAQRPWVAWREIAGSRRRLRQHLQQPIDWFAYPYGGQRGTTRHLVRLAGYRGAFTTEARALGSGEDRYALPRIELAA